MYVPGLVLMTTKMITHFLLQGVIGLDLRREEKGYLTW